MFQGERRTCCTRIHTFSVNHLEASTDKAKKPCQLGIYFFKYKNGCCYLEWLFEVNFSCHLQVKIYTKLILRPQQNLLWKYKQSQ